MEKNQNRTCCATCKNLTTEVTRNGLKPVCRLDRHRFPERIKIDYQEDKDINTKKCEEFEHFEEKY